MGFKQLSLVLITLGTTGLCSAAYADCNTGFYIGAQVGYGKADYGDAITQSFTDTFGDTPDSFGITLKKTTKDDGFAGRGYAGFQFNQYFGVEAGYTRFSDNNYKAFGTDSTGAIVVTLPNSSIKTQQIDVLAKIGTPFGNSGFRADIKAGPAYVKADSGVGSSSSQNNWDPAAGASFAYNFTQNFAMDISYLHAFGSGSLSSPNTDLATLGVSYLFA